jgi:hypothetical protein
MEIEFSPIHHGEHGSEIGDQPPVDFFRRSRDGDESFEIAAVDTNDDVSRYRASRGPWGRTGGRA